MKKIFWSLMINAFLLVINFFSQAQIPDPSFGTAGQVGPLFNGFHPGRFDKSMALDANGKIVIAGNKNAGTNSFDFAAMRLNADGTPDATFGTGGLKVIELAGTSEEAVGVAIQTNGKIILTGSRFYFSNSIFSEDIVVMRLNSDGSLDNSFDGDGIKIIDIARHDQAHTISLQADGKILIGGFTSLVDGFAGRDYLLIRLNNDGTPDNNFNGIGYNVIDFDSDNDEINSITIQADGKIIAAGISSPAGNLNDFSVARLNTDGSLDNGFDGDGKKLFEVVNIPGRDGAFSVIEKAGKILIAGNAFLENSTSGSGKKGFLVVRLNGDGTMDNTFDGDGKRDIQFSSYDLDEARAITVQDDGKILISGNVVSLNNGFLYFDIGVARLNDDGSLDVSFDTDGKFKYDYPVSNDFGNSMLFQPDGRLLVGNLFANFSLGIIRLILDPIAPIITCPANIEVNTDAGQCTASVSLAGTNAATATGDPTPTITYIIGTSEITSPYTFPIGNTTVTATATNGVGEVSCTFTVTVTDNTPPLITCPQYVNVYPAPGSCTAFVSTAAIGTATATDNCTGTVTITHSNFPAGNIFTGVTTITWTATDIEGNSSTCLQTITVLDNQLPVISNEAPSIVTLSPANHTMRNVYIGYDVFDNCPAVTTALTVSSNEPVNGTADGDTDPDWVVTDNHNVQLRAERSANGDGRVYTITITATDLAGNTATKTVEVRVPHDIKNPHSGQAFIVGSTVNFTGDFWDKAGNKHTAKWMIDETTTAKAAVTEPSGNKNGKVTGSYKFTAPGVYKLQMNITDQNNLTTYTNTSGDLEAIVVIFDPNGGNTYGGGYYNSPAGALKSNPTATGKASYGFAMNYFKNSTYPKGETQFEFKVGTFEFNALNFDYLVISNSMAQFKGTGKIIGGQSGVGFTMTVTDGQLDGSGVDKIRMKFYNKNTGQVYYDNQPGASDAALPTQAVGANSIIVISGTNSMLTTANRTQSTEIEVKPEEVINDFDVIAFPNPSATNFTINVKGNAKEKIKMQVTDMYGRIIETKNVIANSITRFGDRYRPGTYFVRMMQGKEHKEIKLIKLSD